MNEKGNAEEESKTETKSLCLHSKSSDGGVVMVLELCVATQSRIQRWSERGGGDEGFDLWLKVLHNDGS